MALASALGVTVAHASVNDHQSKGKSHSLQGTWRASVQFVDGPYAAVKDLKFLIAFNEGGTLTESANYDENPPVTPAYGIWRKIGRHDFELRYEYFNTKPPTKFEDVVGGGGWTPGGIGVLKERVKLSADGDSYTSTITFVLRDEHGKPIPGSGKAICKGERMRF